MLRNKFNYKHNLLHFLLQTLNNLKYIMGEALSVCQVCPNMGHVTEHVWWSLFPPALIQQAALAALLVHLLKQHASCIINMKDYFKHRVLQFSCTPQEIVKYSIIFTPQIIKYTLFFCSRENSTIAPIDLTLVCPLVWSMTYYNTRKSERICYQRVIHHILLFKL